MKYNIGDKLTILEDDNSSHFYNKGTVVTVEGYYNGNDGVPYMDVVDDDGMPQTVGYSEVEPYVEPQEALTGEIVDTRDLIIGLQRIVINSLVDSLEKLEKDYDEVILELEEFYFRLEGLEK